MCQNRSENGRNLFGQVDSQLHGQTFCHLVQGGKWFRGCSACGLYFPAASRQHVRKFGYSEHCVYTGAMLSFICILLWFLEIQFWERKFLVLISGDSFWERRFLFWYLGISIWNGFSFGFLEEYEKHGDASWCVVSEWNLFWFLELRGFETVSNGFYHVPCLPVRWTFVAWWFVACTSTIW